VRIISCQAGSDLTRAIANLHSLSSVSGLVAFESYKLGVKVGVVGCVVVDEV
jgi:hypothetical protein